MIMVEDLLIALVWVSFIGIPFIAMNCIYLVIEKVKEKFQKKEIEIEKTNRDKIFEYFVSGKY